MDDKDSLAREASRWVSVMEEAGPLEYSELTAWLFEDPAHVAEYLEMLEIERALHCVDPARLLIVPRQ